MTRFFFLIVNKNGKFQEIHTTFSNDININFHDEFLANATGTKYKDNFVVNVRKCFICKN